MTTDRYNRLRTLHVMHFETQKLCAKVTILRPVYSDTTQLDVEMSTRSQREQLSPISSECRDPVRVSSDATQLDIELSCVAINGPLSSRAMSVKLSIRDGKR